MPKITAQKPPKALTTLTPAVNGGLEQYTDAWGLLDQTQMLMYGSSGTGKTTLSATFPGPILWLVCSGGKNPGELRSIDTPEYRKKITARVVRSVMDMDKLVAMGKDFATVVLDHATGFRDLTLQEILGLEKLPAVKDWGMATRDQYGMSTRQCIEVFRTLLGLSCNVVIIAQERNQKEEGGGDSELPQHTIVPDLPQGVRNWLHPALDFSVYTHKVARYKNHVSKEKGQEVTTRERLPGMDYSLLVGPHEKIYTKFRRPRSGKDLPERLNDPSYTKIQELIKG